jgi:hypothetical protein
MPNYAPRRHSNKSSDRSPRSPVYKESNRRRSKKRKSRRYSPSKIKNEKLRDLMYVLLATASVAVPIYAMYIEANKPKTETKENK